MIAIKTTNLGKKYAKYAENVSMRTARDLLGGLFRKTSGVIEDFWAIKGVHFEIERGDFVGLLGHNGAGKTTLLRLLSQITTPSTGRVEIQGRVGSLLGATSGFHPELTGRENVFLSSAIIGISPREAKKYYEKIVDFADIRPFMDVPVKHYSSGMRSRLGFAISAFVVPDILILDEILAVGDITFQKQAIRRTREISKEGHTIIYVSHQMEEVATSCNKVMVLHHGELRFFGETQEGIRFYKELLQNEGSKPKAHVEVANQLVKVSKVEFTSGHDKILPKQPTSIRIAYQKMSSQTRAVLCVRFFDSAGVRILQLKSDALVESQGVLTCQMPYLPFQPGTYKVEVSLFHDEAEPAKLQESFLFVSHDPKQEKQLYEESDSFAVPYAWRQD